MLVLWYLPLAFLYYSPSGPVHIYHLDVSFSSVGVSIDVSTYTVFCIEIPVSMQCRSIYGVWTGSALFANASEHKGYNWKPKAFW